MLKLKSRKLFHAYLKEEPQCNLSPPLSTIRRTNPGTDSKVPMRAALQQAVAPPAKTEGGADPWSAAAEHPLAKDSGRESTKSLWCCMVRCIVCVAERQQLFWHSRQRTIILRKAPHRLHRQYFQKSVTFRFEMFTGERSEWRQSHFHKTVDWNAAAKGDKPVND